MNLTEFLPNPNQNYVLLQIGANDGIQDDPIREYIIKTKIKSHLLEPIPVFYEELCRNYKNENNVNCYNLAIHEKTGKQIMSYVNDSSLPVWTKGLGTFDTSKNGFSGYGNYKLQTDLTNDPTFLAIDSKKETIEVETITLTDFFKRECIDRIDVYVTDTEGYDGKIFEQLDLHKYSPKVIMMETHTLGDEQNEKIIHKLEKYNYSVLENGWDTIAVKND